jgi:Spy/CpxP family protein refolding chaperone
MVCSEESGTRFPIGYRFNPFNPFPAPFYQEVDPMFARRIAMVAAAVLTLGGAIALANPSNLFSNPLAQGPVEQKGRRSEEGWLENLNLSQEQIQKIQAIRSRYRNDLSKQRQTMQQAQKEMRELLASDASADQVREKYRQVRTLKQQHADNRFNSLLEIREVLTLEQRRQFVKRMKQQRENRKRPPLERSDKSDRRHWLGWGD